MSFHHSREPRATVCFPRYKGPLHAALSLVGVALVLVLGTATLYASNQAMGELHLKGKSKVEKTSGVWIDGQYVGYLKELKGSKKILLLPGQHTVMVRQ